MSGAKPLLLNWRSSALPGDLPATLGRYPAMELTRFAMIICGGADLPLENGSSSS
jgi:hypothetical protein